MNVNLLPLQKYQNDIVYLINSLLVPTLIAIAFITFLWGIYKYFILGATSDTERQTGRQFVLWGIIGFVVIFSIWGLVAIVGATLVPPVPGVVPKYPLL